MLSQNQLVNALMKPEAYDEPPGHVELVQTHISFVFLTQKFVYKVKKAVNLGFVDFTTLRKRRFFCQKELELNRRLCPDLYLEVVPINKASTFKVKGEGKTVDYAVKMKRLPQEKIMSKLLEEGKVDVALVENIAKLIADFHEKAETNSAISQFGSLATVETNWNENFDQTEADIGRTITRNDFDFICDRINRFMKTNAALFQNRMDKGRIRDCHGDIHSGNIFITDRVYIFDAIEFNDRFRYSDVAADVAFLAMDLDFKRRNDLSKRFIETYVEASRDRELLRLLPFYECYRAYVRGKVAGFKLADPNVCDKEKAAAEKEAKAYFRLALAYAKTL
ncbi:MAG: phosphotransferase [Candidatus Bathyarchaeia archaeon]